MGMLWGVPGADPICALLFFLLWTGWAGSGGCQPSEQHHTHPLQQQVLLCPAILATVAYTGKIRGQLAHRRICMPSLQQQQLTCGLLCFLLQAA